MSVEKGERGRVGGREGGRLGGCEYMFCFTLRSFFITHAPPPKQHPHSPTHSPLESFAILKSHHLDLLSPSPKISDLLATQRSSAESYNEDTSPNASGGLTLQQQTQLLAILAGAGFQGGKQQEQGGEAEARPA